MSKAVIHAFCFLLGLVAATAFIVPSRIWVSVILAGISAALNVFLFDAYIIQKGWHDD